MNATIASLSREKLLLRKSNPTRALALGRIVDLAQKEAKAASREASPADIVKACEKLVKESTKDIALFGVQSAEASQLQEDIRVYNEFLPSKLSENTIRVLVEASMVHYDVSSPLTKGAIIKELKSVEGMDMAVLVAVISEYLQ